MLKKNFTALLICAVVLSAGAPSKAFAQTPARPLPEGVVENSVDARAKLKADLRASVAEVTAKSRGAAVTGADIKRLEAGWLDPQTTSQSQSGFTRKQKILVVAVVVVIVGLAVVLAYNSEKAGQLPLCGDDPFDPNCVTAP